MAHRYSNSVKMRESILAESKKYQSWGEIPHNIRLLILEMITFHAQEVLSEIQN